MFTSKALFWLDTYFAFAVWLFTLGPVMVALGVGHDPTTGEVICSRNPVWTAPDILVRGGLCVGLLFDGPKIVKRFSTRSILSATRD